MARIKKMYTSKMFVSGVMLFYIARSYIYIHLFRTNDGDLTSVPLERHKYLSRKLMTSNYFTKEDNKTDCNEPSISNFPRDIFSQKQRRYGAVLLHVFMAVYMFIALAIVCDDYFVSALDKICSYLRLEEDVAGATFMAAGSSAPELFTSIIGVFIAKGDVGVGTIVGSAIFNLLVIIAVCALFAGEVINLTKWPLIRDSLCYLLTIAALIWVIYDGQVTWYESLVLMLIYMGYIILMKFNPRIVKAIEKRKRKRKNQEESFNLLNKTAVEKFSLVKSTEFNNFEEANIDIQKKWRELGMRIMLTDKFSPATRFRAACNIILIQKGYTDIDNQNLLMLGKKASSSHLTDNNLPSLNEEKEVVEIFQPFTNPEGSLIKKTFWLLTLPLVALMYFTIPDCRKPRWEAYYMVTFVVSVIWIFVFSYVMVWMVCIVGYTLGIPDVIMGITFLAAGTSIPDCMASLLVAREGMGDMAVSNSIGSNIFDILIGLALPWFIKTAIITPGMSVAISSKGMLYSVALLFLSIFLVIFVIHVNKWKLDRKLGFIFILFYLVFITISACTEFNLFAYVNLPTCVYKS